MKFSGKWILGGLFLLNFFLFFEGFAAPPKICMVLDKGGKDDHSFNESAVRGFQKAMKDLPISKESLFVEPKNDSQITQYFVNFSTSARCDFIIGIGFNPSSYLANMAQNYPQKKFLAIDSNVEDKNKAKNIRSITFEEHEGSFIVGAIAAMKTKTNKIGFIGGMDVPIIHRFLLGYEAGAKYVNPKIKVTSTFIGVTPDAWNNPSKAKELALAQYENDTDIIFQVAASSGNGIFNAAEDMNKSLGKTKYFAIGVDSNQNWINPKIILTSMIKRVDVSVYNSINEFIHNKFQSGHATYGLQNSGVDWSYDKYNQSFFTTTDIAKINKIKKDILYKKIIVPDFYKQRR